MSWRFHGREVRVKYSLMIRTRATSRSTTGKPRLLARTRSYLAENRGDCATLLALAGLLVFFSSKAIQSNDLARRAPASEHEMLKR
jgi:hypothetical protein